MKKAFLGTLFLLLSVCLRAQYAEYFTDGTMRFDFYHAGNATDETYYFDEVIFEPHWGGTTVHLIDDLGYGNQMVKVFDKQSGALIYSRGYCTLFNEWQSTGEALTADKAYPESVVFPFPKAPVRVELWARDKKGAFNKKFEKEVDPGSYLVKRQAYDLPVTDIVNNGGSGHCVDVVLIPEGYTASQRADFESDCRKFAEAMFCYPPYKENAKRFNIKAVWAPSQDQGVTVPGHDLWKKTAVGASFYTFDTERYQMIDDFQRVRDIAGNTAYDYIYVLSNCDKYGGGGIYNFYGISSAKATRSTEKVYVHEFGHLLLGLADEYVGNVSFPGMYPFDVEPWEENVTTLVDFNSKQWSGMLP